MLTVKCVGHIGTSVGSSELTLDLGEVRASQLIEELRRMSNSSQPPGFTRFNTLVIVNDGEAFTAGADDRVLRDGDRVVLLPFSHGG